MRAFIFLMIIAVLVACAPVQSSMPDSSIGMCQRLAEGELAAQGEVHFSLIQWIRLGADVGEQYRLKYLLDRSYQISQTQVQNFECVVDSQHVQLFAMHDDRRVAVAYLPRPPRH
ncbi:MAG: hypothetical protein QM666_05790 [Acinetobacter sp.]